MSSKYMFSHQKSNLPLICKLLLLILLTSCLQKTEEIKQKENDNIEKQYHDGKLQAEFTVIDGVRQGIGRCYYENGKISTTCNYIDGLKEGMERKFYFDGELYRTREFVKGIFTGTEKRFYENGNLMTVQNYKNAMPSIGLQEYTNTGKLVTDYPELKHKIVYDRDYEKQKLLLFYFSDKNKKVSYYKGPLIEGKYFDTNADLCGINEGVGEIGLDLGFSGEIIISAKYITSNRAPYIVEKRVFIEEY